MNDEDRQRNADIDFVIADFRTWIRFTDNFVATLTKTRGYLDAQLWELEVRGKNEAIPRSLGEFIVKSKSSDDGVFELRKLLKNQCDMFEFEFYDMDSMIRAANLRLNVLGYW